ncbi:hypothetical protein [Paenibacillus sp. YYML68]|uniref:hypothetical protein n=1 Tax=Paenibacillus sp. YYML68 TaxID=2909250 RepID=UPI002493C73D|nr:hypothetical protein [Paenibacillus sp. YYML68]
MTTKTMTAAPHKERDVNRLVTMMTAAAWVVLAIGTLMCLINLQHFSDTNTPLMVGLGFMVGSVHIYVIRTAIHLVHSRQAMNRTDATQ